MQAHGDELDLLKGVNGYFECGTVTALMGSSGAGKTTLLDVLADRKNTGVVRGEVFLNGKPKDVHAFRHIMGYVEQFDSLAPRDTAREAIEFSAAMRLPRGTTVQQRGAWVEHVLDMLELTSLENTIVGDADSGGMSFQQKKRLSIGVELAGNPSILFLDEPTTGLDSRSAQVVIRCIKRVAASGRSIVCTIHQPSMHIFSAFDSLLLLRRGGQTVYFGELGENCHTLVQHFECIEGVTPLLPNYNPATWMLEVIGAGTSGNVSATDFHAYYNTSTLCQVNKAGVDALCSCSGSNVIASISIGGEANPDPNPSTRHQGELYNTTYQEQFKLLTYRAALSYWRSPSYNFARMMISLVIAILFSSTYIDQEYTTDVDTIARSSVMYITMLFTGVIGMISVQPVAFSERPAFYREKQSEMYSVFIYNLATSMIEVCVKLLIYYYICHIITIYNHYL